MENGREEADARRVIPIVAGPTGIGKTDIAIRLARRHPYELISADSMQVYRGMEIGTAQPTSSELKDFRCHLCSVIDPEERFSVKRFLDLSDDARRDIESRGNRPMFVGGTGMYLRALRWGLFDQPEIDLDTRLRLQKEIETLGAPALHERLREVDPVLADRVSPNDAIRIVRGLEVAETTGEQLGTLQSQWSGAHPRFPHVLIILTCPRPVLTARIERRVDAMFDAGWIDETRRLLERGCSPSQHCFKALGYREIVDHLQGKLSEIELREKVKAVSRQFSKRQMTWFRKERDAVWIEFDGINPDEAKKKIEDLLDRKGNFT